ncbi:starch synthase (maltosyl-transferring) [Bradyrhizobium diazoefficiens]
MNKTIQTVESAAAGSAFLIEDVYPLIDGGRFAVKRIAGECVEVWADIYRDGEAVVGAALIWRREQDREWRSEPMIHHGNDRWSGAFTPVEPGQYLYAIEAWTDEFATWSHAIARKRLSGADVSLDAIEGAGLLTKAHGARQDAAAVIVRQCEDYLQTGEVAPLLSAELGNAMAESQSRPDLTRSPLFPLIADRDKARFGAWYQMIPRSQGRIPGRHGTLRDCITRVPYIAAMGFDVLYFTPVHPIGHNRRKGRNNAPSATAGEPGSPYAIGTAEGGHDALHPELGTIEDFRALVATCLEYGLELALDFAVQCSPDHPWLTQHPEWFKWRPDRSVRTADGPYSDIVIPDFASVDRAGLWNAFRDAMLFWIDHGVTIFAIDNHDTAPLPFWEWLIRDIRRRHPEVVLFSKTFARPKLMKGLAKLGFAQSFTYFPWRTSRWELEQHLGELTRYPERDFYRPNLFVNTPDLLPYHLQSGEAWAFKSRLALAATLSGNYGIYSGFELLEHEAIPGREEYLDSEVPDQAARLGQAGQHQALHRRSQPHPQRQCGTPADGEFAVSRHRGRRDDKLRERGDQSGQHRRRRHRALARCARILVAARRPHHRRRRPAPPRHRTRKSPHRRTVPHRMGRDQVAYRSRPRSGAAVPLPGVKA